MTEREKIVVGLTDSIEILSDFDTQEYTFSERQQLHDSVIAAIQDALELLKAQKPRVMTLEEAQTALHNDDVVWVELKDKMICAGIRMDGTDYFTMQNNDVLDVTDFDSGEGAEMYGKEVRCWTSRPDQATREAIPWN